MSLIQEFNAACKLNIGNTRNPYLTFLKASVQEVSNASGNDSVLQKYINDLIQIVKKPYFSSTQALTNDFAQLLGEAHFYLICQNKGINLARIPEQKNVKTPDFKLELESESDEMNFEVKTLSVVAGEIGIKNSLENGLEAEIDLQDQLDAGKERAIAESVVQPYGSKTGQSGNLTTVINTLIEKSMQNIKKGQYPNDKSFLVINLSMLNLICEDNRSLRPVYCDDYLYNKAVSGDLWMAVFGNIGFPIFATPEFEGKPAIESFMNKIGLLQNSDNSMIAGIFFIVNSLSGGSEIFGLFKKEKLDYLKSHNVSAYKVLIQHICNNWNDDYDTNGYCLEG